MKPYYGKLMTLIPCVKKLTFTHVPRMQNRFADSLATLASMIEILVDVKVRPLFIEQTNRPWFIDVQNYIARGLYPEESSGKDRRAIRRFAAQFIICGGKLYKRSYEGTHQLCVDIREGKKIIEQIDARVCGPHMNGHMLAKKILRQGYYWTTLERDYIRFVKRCHQCQTHANPMNVPPS